MAIAKNREEYGLIKTDLSKQKIGDKKARNYKSKNRAIATKISLNSQALPN